MFDSFSILSHFRMGSFSSPNGQNRGPISLGIATSAALLACGGCAAAPKVGHALITSPDQLTGDQIATYSLQENVVTIKEVTSGEGDKKKTTMSAVLDREDHEGKRIALLKRGGIGINTDVSIKKFENTDIPSEVTVKVEDTRADLVKKTGEVVIALVKSGLVGFSQQNEAVLPARINLSRLIPPANRDGGTVQAPGNFQVEFLELPPDAVPTAEVSLARVSSYFYYAACRKAVVSFRHGGQPYQYTFKVSDPNFLQRQRMPVDGKIVMHSQCGASVTGKMSGDDASSSLAITSALIAQGQAIKEAIEAAKDDEE